MNKNASVILEYYYFVANHKNISFKALSSSRLAGVELAKIIGNELKRNKKVLWLISGGSSLPIACEANKLLTDVDRRCLGITLVDDIYNLDKNKSSNSEQLMELGFKLNGAQFYPLLKEGRPRDITAIQFGEYLEERLEWTEFSIGQFGLGTGMHTGGIQPFSIAASENNKLSIGYDDHGIERVTVTPKLISLLDVAFVNSFGEEKRPLVERFLNSSSSVMEEPTQSLKTAKNCHLYTDVLPV